jgi:hypothetical protein
MKLRRIRAVTAVTLLTLAVAAVPGVAFAGEGSVRGGGSGSANDRYYASSGTDCHTPTRSGKAAAGPVFRYTSPFSECAQGAGDRISANGVGFETAWYEIWRFYGPKSNPGAAYTVSRAHKPTWGSDSASVNYVISAPHPDDDGIAASNSVWRKNTTPANGPYAKIMDIDGDYDLPGRVTYVGATVAGSTKPVVGSDVPLRRAGSCKTYQSSAPVFKEAFNIASLEYNSEQSKAFRAVVFDVYKTFADVHGVQSGLHNANVKLRIGVKAPKSGADFTWDDGVDCSSVFDFVKDDPDNAVQITYCYVPVEVRWKKWQDYSSGIYSRNYTVRGGPRYSQNPGTQFALNSTSTTTRNQSLAKDPIRKAIWNEVRGRPITLDKPTGTPYTVANVDGAGHPNYSTSELVKAADAATRHATCQVSEGYSYSTTPAASPPSPPTGQIALSMDAPTSFLHMGGRLKPAKMTVTAADNYKCPKAFISCKTIALSYGVSLSAVGSPQYKPCSGTATSCDFKTEQGTRTSGAVMRTNTVHGYFYRATTGTQRVTMAVTNPKATIRYSYRTTVTYACPSGRSTHITMDGRKVASVPTFTTCSRTVTAYIDKAAVIGVPAPRTYKVTAATG